MPSADGERGVRRQVQGLRETEQNAWVEHQNGQKIRVLGLRRRWAVGQDRKQDREQGREDIKDQRI